MLRCHGGAGELSLVCWAPWLQWLTLPVPPWGTSTEGEAARGASWGRAVASKAMGHFWLPRALHTYPVQRSSTSQGT